MVGNPSILLDEGYLLRGAGEGDVEIVFNQDEYNRALGIAAGTEMPENLYARASGDTDSALRTAVGAVRYEFVQGGTDTEANGDVTWVYNARFPTNGFMPALYPVTGLKFGMDFYSDQAITVPLNFLPAISILPNTDGHRWQILASSDNHNPANSSLKNREQSTVTVRNIGADDISAFNPLGINLVDTPAGIIETQITLSFRNADSSGYGFGTAQTNTYHASDTVNIGDLEVSEAFNVADTSTYGNGALALERGFYKGNPAVKVNDTKVYLAKDSANNLGYYTWADATSHSLTGNYTLSVILSAELERCLLYTSPSPRD